jgi:hypothetical protein
MAADPLSSAASGCRCTAHLVWIPAEPDPDAATASPTAVMDAAPDEVLELPMDVGRVFELAHTGAVCCGGPPHCSAVVSRPRDRVAVGVEHGRSEAAQPSLTAGDEVAADEENPPAGGGEPARAARAVVQTAVAAVRSRARPGRR